jgi:DNA (cytosine-5)-methyltransferase 1
MLTYLAIADKFRPRWLVWENVPGVLSSNEGKDFGTFLGGLGELGYGFAYRILDAQYFGVAQRRRRVFVVGYLGDWKPAAAVLFERYSLQGNSAPSRKAREKVATGSGTGFDSTCLHGTVGALCADTHPGGYSGQDAYTGRLIPHALSYDMKQHHNPQPSDTVQLTTSNCATVRGDTPLVQPVGTDLYNGTITGDIACTFTADATSANHSGPTAMQPIPIHDQATRHAGKNGDKTMGKGNGLGIGQPGDPMNTLTKGDHHAVAYNIAPGKGKLKDDIHVTDAYITKTIDASGSNPAMHQGGAAIVQPIEVNAQTAWSMNLMSPGRQIREDDGVGALTQDAHRPTQGNEAVVIQQAMAVRRLTPKECERLQGFPDNYTDIKLKNKPTPDGPRYKSLGNSMAVPVMAWIGQRIQKVEEIIKL